MIKNALLKSNYLSIASNHINNQCTQGSPRNRGGF